MFGEPESFLEPRDIKNDELYDRFCSVINALPLHTIAGKKKFCEVCDRLPSYKIQLFRNTRFNSFKNAADNVASNFSVGLYYQKDRIGVLDISDWSVKLFFKLNHQYEEGSSIRKTRITTPQELSYIYNNRNFLPGSYSFHYIEFGDFLSIRYGIHWFENYMESIIIALS